MAENAIDHPNAVVVRRGYDAFNAGDIAAVRDTFADDIVWHVAGRSRFTGDKRGIDATLGFFADLLQATSGTFNLEVHDVLANDVHTVALVTQSFELEGRKHQDMGAHVAHFKHGKVTESWFFAWNPYDVDELFPG